MHLKINGSLRNHIILNIYFLFYLFLYQFLFAGLIYSHFGLEAYRIVNVLVCVFVFAAEIMLYFPYIVDDIGKFKNHWKDCLKQSFGSVLFIYLSNAAVTVFIYMPLHLTEAENQVNNDAMFQADPAGFFFSALLFAPIVEEIVFRGVILNQLEKSTNAVMAIAVSSILFGALHVLASLTAGNWTQLLYLIEYGLAGFWLALGAKRTNTIVTSISAHFAINLFASLIMLF